MFIPRIAKNCLDILFPPACTGCGMRLKPECRQNFCDRCIPEIRYIRLPFCRVCGLEVHGEEGKTPLCGKCLRDPPAFSTARSLVRYEPMIQQLVHRLKFGRDTSVINGFSDLAKNFDLSDFSGVDCIVPVPLHIRRLRQRGLNQAVLLARLFFPDRHELIRTDLLIRTRHTVPQTELGGDDRRENLKAAFQVRNKCDLNDIVVCLVDDVFTTGTTVEECSRVLLKAGAREVRVVTLARVGMSQRGRTL
jgi:ComF family protein